MIAIGIDVGKGKHAMSAVDESGRQVVKPAFYDNNREGAKKIVASLAKVAPPDGPRIGMEPHRVRLEWWSKSGGVAHRPSARVPDRHASGRPPDSRLSTFRPIRPIR